MNEELLENIFKKANEMFLEKEIELIEKDISERALCSAMVKYLLYEMRKCNVGEKYDVDVEYNRNGSHPKTIYDSNSGFEQTITCDLIIHSRGKDKYQDNLMCVEMKKSTRNDFDKEKDKLRLKLLTKKSFDGEWKPDGKTLPKYVCNYLLGIYYEIDMNKNMIYLEFYKDGEKFKEDRVNF